MGTISSGVGLISGLDYQSLIDKLMQTEAGPRDQVVTRMSNLDAQKAAYLDLSARITALMSRIQLLAQPRSFQATKVQSSLPDVLSATSSAGARPGAYQFSVRALAATHQLVSRGFAAPTTTLTPGTVTIESAQARVNIDTRLDELNGHTGVQRGSFKITNAAGASATINIADTLTLGEVVDKINAAGISVTASVRNDTLVLTDGSTGTDTLRVQDLSGGQTAANLGFGIGHTSDSDHDGKLDGAAIMYLSAATPLSALNDGLGIRHSLAGGDFSAQVGGTTVNFDLSDVLKQDTRLARLNHGQGVRLGRVKITSRDGASVEVDLSNAKTAADVQQALQGAFGNSRITVTLTSSRMLVSDSTQTPTGSAPIDFVIADVTGHAAQDLGIDGRSGTGKIDGRNVLHMSTVADVLAAINYGVGNDDGSGHALIAASLSTDGHALVLTNQSAAGGPLTLSAGTDSTSHALADLGLQPGTYDDTGGGASVTGTRILGGIDTVLLKTLNGGAGFAGGTIRIAAGGQTADVDLSTAQTLADVVDQINQAAASAQLGIEASYDSTGTRLLVANLDGGAGSITISDVTGDFAARTGLNQTGAAIRSNNLQRQYISENTRVADLSNGRGVSFGSIKVTNSAGVSKTLPLSATFITTLQDVIRDINGLDIGVQARINDTGDGLLVTDAAGGTGPLKIEDVDGTSARDLNIRGEATDGRIDGSYEFKLTIGGSDTLEGLAARVGSGTTLAEARLLDDGTDLAPYRLSLTSRVNGARGGLIVDGGETGLGIGTLARAQDARLFYGGNADAGVLLSSSSNTFADVVGGLTVTANRVQDEPVAVTVTEDLESLTTSMSDLVTSFNDAMSKIKNVGGYNQDTQKGGVLLGDSTLRMAESRLINMFTRYVAGTAGLHSLAQVGLKYDSKNGMTFDQDKFQQAYQADPEGVTRFFTDEKTGVATTIKGELDALTKADGPISSRTGALDNEKKSLQERVDHLNDMLDRKRSRLTQQFQAMEAALAQLQSQQSTLSSLSSLAQNWVSSTKSSA